MKPVRSFGLLKLSITVIFSACLFAAVANAAPMRGSFTLPFEAQWHMAVLPVGDYTLTLENTSVGTPIFFVRDSNRHAVMVLSPSYTNLNISDENFLVVLRHGRQNIIQALQLGCIGVRYTHPLPKGVKPATEIAGTVHRIPIVATIKSAR